MLGGLVVATMHQWRAAGGFADRSGAQCRPLCRCCSWWGWRSSTWSPSCWPCWPGSGGPSRARSSPPSTPDGITLQKDGFSYSARWPDADLVAESRAAFLMKFNQLYMRLPKRGFTDGDRCCVPHAWPPRRPMNANRIAPDYRNMRLFAWRLVERTLRIFAAEWARCRRIHARLVAAALAATVFTSAAVARHRRSEHWQAGRRAEGAAGNRRRAAGALASWPWPAPSPPSPRPAQAQVHPRPEVRRQ